jgi:hypothetical protein
MVTRRRGSWVIAVLFSGLLLVSPPLVHSQQRPFPGQQGAQPSFPGQPGAPSGFPPQPGALQPQPGVFQQQPSVPQAGFPPQPGAPSQPGFPSQGFASPTPAPQSFGAPAPGFPPQPGFGAAPGAPMPGGTWSWPPQGSVWPVQPGPQETVAPSDPNAQPVIPGAPASTHVPSWLPPPTPTQMPRPNQ